MSLLYPASDIAATHEMGRPISLTFMGYLRAAESAMGAEITAACTLAKTYMRPLPHVGGSTMRVRMAARFGAGYNVERAAAREYLYRWALYLDRATPDGRGGAVFGAPHALGM